MEQSEVDQNINTNVDTISIWSAVFKCPYVAKYSEFAIIPKGSIITDYKGYKYL